MERRTDFAWQVPDRFNFARDVIDAAGADDRLGLLFVDRDLRRRWGWAFAAMGAR